MKGSNFYGSPLKQSVTLEKNREKGKYSKTGRSETPGPVVGSVFDSETEDKNKTSDKIGPVESPEAMDKKYEAHYAAKDKISAGAKKGDSLETYMGEGPASAKTRKTVEEARAYEKK